MKLWDCWSIKCNMSRLVLLLSVFLVLLLVFGLIVTPELNLISVVFEAGFLRLPLPDFLPSGCFLCASCFFVSPVDYSLWILLSLSLWIVLVVDLGFCLKPNLVCWALVLLWNWFLVQLSICSLLLHQFRTIKILLLLGLLLVGPDSVPRITLNFI